VPADLQKARDLFLHAVGKVPPEQWEKYVSEACGPDLELEDQVRHLLKVHEEAGSFLEKPAVALVGTVEDAIAEGPGTVIGPYKLLEQIGEGGFGVVFVAEQMQPIRRKVALKVLKPGMDTRQVVARFEAERQALALMDHPNIAQVHDGGETASGRPFFVMELVRGVPITEFCDQNRLGVRERLELFVSVCEAVQHAHQKGVIHRDLKPSNVLVTRHDDKAVPKVIDFGIAKATGQQLTEKTLFTNFAQMIGTPLYMSPEQAQLSGLDVDTRSDVYSLGVLLYELLTGTTPFDKERFKEAGYDEMRRIIREEEPPRPSTRLSTVGRAATTASANRGSDPRRLSRLFRGELDWVVMKALEKDRNRRYESASAFAADVRRYLANEAVLACPPSAAYRLRKFARRNKVGLAVAGLILFFLAVLGGGGGWVLRDRAAREEAVAKERRDRQQRLTARVEQMLDDVDQLERDQKWPEAQAAALRAEAVLGGGEADDAIRRRVGDVRRELALVARLDRIRQERAAIVNGQWNYEWNYAGAARDYAQAFQEYGVAVDHLPADTAVDALRGKPALAAPVAAALDDWVEARRALGEGEPSWKPLVAVARGLDPDPLRDRLRAAWGQEVTEVQADLRQLAESIDVKAQSPATLIALAKTLNQAQLADAALRTLQDGQNANPADFWLNFELGLASEARNDYADALRYGTAAVSLRPDSPIAHNILGSRLFSVRKLGAAVAEFRKAVEFDPKNPVHHINLGCFLDIQEKPGEAVAEYRKAVELDPKNAWVHSGIGTVLYRQGKLDEAAAEFREAIRLDKDLRTPHALLKDIYLKRGAWDQAAAEFAALFDQEPSPHSPDPFFWFEHACLRLQVGDAAGYHKLCERMRERFGESQNVLEFALLAHACVLAPGGAGDAAAGIRLAERRLALTPPPSVHDAWSMHVMGLARYRAGQDRQAVEWLNKGLEENPAWTERGLSWLVLAMAHHRLGQTDEARRWFDKTDEWIEEITPKQPDKEGSVIPPDWNWRDWLMVQLLRREAKEALRKKPGT
jgi:serine/threonine protein kinase/Flp pilus assembly protein TadD